MHNGILLNGEENWNHKTFREMGRCKENKVKWGDLNS